MVRNLALLESERSSTLTNRVFLNNHALIKYGAMAQIGLIFFPVWVSVVKPWRKKTDAA